MNNLLNNMNNNVMNNMNNNMMNNMNNNMNNNMMNNMNQMYMNFLNLASNMGQANAQNQNQEKKENNEDEELIKYVLEGMGEEPSGLLENDINTILNFVPSSDSDKFIIFPGCTGKFINITFKQGNGNFIELTVPEDAKLKDVFVEYGKKQNLNDINKAIFLINGERLTSNSEGTLKEKYIQDKGVFLVI